MRQTVTIEAVDDSLEEIHHPWITEFFSCENMYFKDRFNSRTLTWCQTRSVKCPILAEIQTKEKMLIWYDKECPNPHLHFRIFSKKIGSFLFHNDFTEVDCVKSQK